MLRPAETDTPLTLRSAFGRSLFIERGPPILSCQGFCRHEFALLLESLIAAPPKALYTPSRLIYMLSDGMANHKC